MSKAGSRRLRDQLVQSANTVWAIPGALGENNIATGPVPGVFPSGSSLTLPTTTPGR